MPPKKLSGTEITRAQGQETISRMSARSIHSCHSAWNSSGGTMASSTATTTTMGV